MVRFIIFSARIASPRSSNFTFQYGQIYYRLYRYSATRIIKLYIPIWLDLLYLLCVNQNRSKQHLHSNMVRFIIYRYGRRVSESNEFYIPIWLDLLYNINKNRLDRIIILHSNMVRFIIWKRLFNEGSHWLLHSNMVRFIISAAPIPVILIANFTFQYGQIYYPTKRHEPVYSSYFYIPIWLDLLLTLFSFQVIFLCILHSNMVRFIINNFDENLQIRINFTFQYGQIYYTGE